MTESLLIPQYYTPPTVEPCPKCGAVHWTHTDMGQGYDRMRCNECHTAIWGFAGVIPAEPALDTWNALSKERQRLQAELDATKDKLAKAEGLLIDAIVQLEEGKIKTRRNRAVLIRQFLAELTGGKHD